MRLYQTGIEDWQVALSMPDKNAIIAKDITDDMEVDMDDVNYSAIDICRIYQGKCDGTSILDPRSGNT